jgi:hypothetical protein
MAKAPKASDAVAKMTATKKNVPSSSARATDIIFIFLNKIIFSKIK